MFLCDAEWGFIDSEGFHFYWDKAGPTSFPLSLLHVTAVFLHVSGFLLTGRENPSYNLSRKRGKEMRFQKGGLPDERLLL